MLDPGLRSLDPILPEVKLRKFCTIYIHTILQHNSDAFWKTPSSRIQQDTVISGSQDPVIPQKRCTTENHPRNIVTPVQKFGNRSAAGSWDIVLDSSVGSQLTIVWSQDPTDQLSKFCVRYVLSLMAHNFGEVATTRILGIQQDPVISGSQDPVIRQKPNVARYLF
jgi:hypothetical protein